MDSHEPRINRWVLEPLYIPFSMLVTLFLAVALYFSVGELGSAPDPLASVILIVLVVTGLGAGLLLRARIRDRSRGRDQSP